MCGDTRSVYALHTERVCTPMSFMRSNTSASSAVAGTCNRHAVRHSNAVSGCSATNVHVSVWRHGNIFHALKPRVSQLGSGRRLQCSVSATEKDVCACAESTSLRTPMSFMRSNTSASSAVAGTCSATAKLIVIQGQYMHCTGMRAVHRPAVSGGFIVIGCQYMLSVLQCAVRPCPSCAQTPRPAQQWQEPAIDRQC
jgi:hypothetical protein